MSEKPSQNLAFSDHESASENDQELSLGERTYSLISDMIFNGELEYGDPVQERRLAELLNVSRTPVREAINRLEAEGFLERTCGRVIVREVKLKEFVEILHVRKLLECDAAREAAQNIDPDEIQKVRENIEKLLDKEKVTGLELREADDEFHNFIARNSNNSLLVELIADLRRKTSMFDHERLPNRKNPGNKEHLEILDALAAGDGALAAERMANHINNVHSSIFSHWGFNK
ncbi:GntR family transcriptional regulator [Pseudemcibacter aquimaris]|uniref:GntR family transcriptional regulator n=1 Tax=Pseudemcibacter aquimaris TaxID=2857064 RepID=UPI0020129360|nr:GntR family transcriptional regulator [Pseudemcibacter aquimaris]MCC3861744.1 GntR family transcriptional regulator [Pseudemcibacter aquimaris]WDU58513.1 GntR family transcriptional regulator [Pseudemcibacter aquimaris]